MSPSLNNSLVVDDSANTPSPPGPLWQHFNALLHREPIASVVHALYWIAVLTMITPMATMFLCVQAVYAIVVWALGWSADHAYHPQKQPNQDGASVEMAVVITGCDSGFGMELALQAAHAGFVVFAGCLSATSFDQFAQTNIIPIVMNVTKDDDVREAVERVQKWTQARDKKMRVLHALCNNAGILVPGFVDWNDLSAVQKTMDVNFMGVVRCCKGFLPLFKQQVKTGKHAGRIVNLASMAGKAACFGNLTAYSASKHAVVAFSHGLRVDLAPFGIQVGTICPTFHGTPMVRDAGQTFDENWNLLPKRVTEEYGEDYRDFSIKQHMVARRLMWRMDVVVEQLLKSLTSRQVPAEMLVGCDAKFGVSFSRMLPHWVVDLVMQHSVPMPVPACLRKKA